MKVAIVEWFPRICGATDWGLHLSAARLKGVEVQLVTFSKSGKVLKDWNRPELYRVEKIRDAVETLNAYDLVVVTDVVCFAPQLVKRGREVPYYVDVLNRLKTPWTSMYHGGTYPSKYDETLKAVLGSPSFLGTLMTTRLPEARARLDSIYGARYVNHPFLPYSPTIRAPIDPPWKSRQRESLMTARIAVNKGQNALFGLLPLLRGDVNLWGYNAFGLPSIGWRLWELGNALGYEVIEEAQLREDALKLTHPRARRFYTGRYEFRAACGRGGYGARLRYHRSYVHLEEIDWSPLVHVSLANDDFKGTLEYVTLDAMNCGAMVVVPEHAIEYCRRAYGDAVTTVPYGRCNLWAKGAEPKVGDYRGQIDGEPMYMAKKVNDLLAMGDRAIKRRLAEQREALTRLHAPEKVLKKIIEMV